MSVRLVTRRRSGLCVGLLSLLLVSGPLNAEPAAITGLYDELRIAIEMEDMDAIVSRMTPLLRFESSLGKGLVPALGAIFARQSNLAAELGLDEVQAVGDKVFVRVTWAISGQTEATGEPWSTTMRRADLLVRRGTEWQLLMSDEIDRSGLGKITDTVFDDPANGLRLTAPGGWRLMPITGARCGVMAMSPQADMWVTWMVVDVPGTFSAEELARTEHDVITKLAPTLELTMRDVVLEPASLAGRPAHRLAWTIVAPGGTELRAGSVYCPVGSTLYAVASVATPPSAQERYQAEVDRAIASTVITSPEVSDLPPEAGRVEGRKYINDAQGCEITAPEGWDIKVGQGHWNVQVSMEQPGGGAFITLGMIDLPDPTVTAEQAVLSDDNVSSQAFEGFEVVSQAETAVGDLPAYESITRFRLGDGTRQRWRLYLVDEGRLFFLVGDVPDVEAWDRLQPILKEAFQSLRLSGAQAPAAGA